MPSEEDLSTEASDKETFSLEVQLEEIIGSAELWVSWPWASLWLRSDSALSLSRPGNVTVHDVCGAQVHPFLSVNVVVEALTLTIAKQWGS